GLMRTNVTLFSGKYDDIQVTNYLFTRCDGAPACDGPLTQLPNLHLTNAAAAKVEGLEFEGTIFPADRWSVTANLGFLDARYTEVGAAADAVYIGAPFAQAPDRMASIGVTYELPLASGGTFTP